MDDEPELKHPALAISLKSITDARADETLIPRANSANKNR